MSDVRYRQLGTSGLRVAEVALGTMTFSAPALPRGAVPSPGASWSWCADEADARAIFARYIERGGNFIDTADVYAGGTAEPFVGELIAPVRDRLVVATKFGLSTADGDVGASGSSLRTLTRALDASLRRLDTDRIDLLWLHAWDGITPLDEVAQALDLAVRSGKVLYVGVSDTAAWAVALVHELARRRGTPLTAVQVRYSVVDRAAELELLPMAAHLGLGVVAFGVLGGGVLSGKYARSESGRRDPSTVRPTEQRAIAAVHAVSVRRRASPVQVALAWARTARPGVVPIVGARTIGQFDDALGGLGLVLDDEDHDELAAACAPPVLFPHDVTAAIEPDLRGGTLRHRFEVPRGAAFGEGERRATGD